MSTITEKALINNIKKFYLYRLVSRFYIYLFVLVIIFLNYGLNYFEIGILLAVFGLTVTLFEMPSGIIADRYGRKFSLFVGELSKMAGVVVLAIANNFLFLVIGQLLSGLGYTLASGADSAFLYDTHVHLKNVKEYKENEAKSSSYMFISVLIAGVIGGILADINIRSPLLFTAPFHLIAAIIALSFYEPKREKLIVSHGVELNSIINEFKVNPIITCYVLYYALTRATIMVTAVALLPLYFFQELKVNLIFFGIILGSFTLTAFIVGKNMTKIINRIGKQTLWIIVPILIIASILLLGFFRSFLGMFVPMIMGVSAGLVRPMVLGQINEVTSDEKRATILSTAELLFGLFNAGLLLIISYTVYLTNLSRGLILLGGITSISFILIALLFVFYSKSGKDSRDKMKIETFEN